MSTFLDRMEKELDDLEEKSMKLNAFIDSEKFFDLDNQDQFLLKAQEDAMHVYIHYLSRRIQKHKE